jgi:ribose transport system ATP-binding protein
MSELLLKMEGISKQFPGVLALDNVDFELRAGEVHVLAGENGAGKSTLIKILSGNFAKDSGKIHLQGKEVTIHSARGAQQLGIATIHQEFSLVSELTIAQNIFRGHEPKKNPLMIDWKQMFRDAEELLRNLGIEMDPRDSISNISVSHKQLVEIAKAMSIDSKIIIFDEPTGALTSKDIDFLFDLIRNLKAKGMGIIYISHRMEEISEIGDRITVLRDGCKISTYDVKGMDITRIIFDMTKQNLKQKYIRKFSHELGSEIMEVKHLSQKALLKDISFSVRQGEIVGFYGLIGSGRSELVKAVFGLDRFESGEVYIYGEKIKPNTKKSVGKGMAFIPEDRNLEGLCLNLTVRENLMHASMSHVFKTGLVNKTLEKKMAKKVIDQLRIKTPSDERIVNFLSGGNKQKVVLGKWLIRDQKLFIFDEPTRGIDVGAKAEFYRIMDELVTQGAAVIMISSEIPEILSMSDRIYVMKEGRIANVFSREEATQEKLLESAIL